MTNILVVDDSATMRRMVMAALRGLDDVGFHEAQSGLEAIERLSVEPVDLVLCGVPDKAVASTLAIASERGVTRGVSSRSVTSTMIGTSGRPGLRTT